MAGHNGLYPHQAAHGWQVCDTADGGPSTGVGVGHVLVLTLGLFVIWDIGRMECAD